MSSNDPNAPGFRGAELLLSRSRNQAWAAEILLLLSRLYAGITIASAGWDKLPSPDWMTDQVTQIGFPAPELSATAACLTEFIAGICLALGLFTRPAALSLAIVMGVASFGFHKVTPILDMHIAQGFVWLFVVYVAIGGGRLSLDRLALMVLGSPSAERAPRRGPAWALALLVFALPLGVGAWRQFLYTPPPPAPAAPVAIESLSLAGTFNEWDLDASPMTQADDGAWRVELDLEPGPIEFKFAANNAWDVNLGASEAQGAGFPVEGVGEPGGDNIAGYIPVAGRYAFTADPETRAYALSRVSQATPDRESLLGAWSVDLRPAPEAEPYLVTLNIESVEGGRVEGTFYNGSQIRDGQVTMTWGSVRLAFVTEDGSGEYHTSAVLRGDRLEGTTLSLGRGFLMEWRGERGEE